MLLALFAENLLKGFFDDFGYWAPFAFLVGAGAGLPVPEEVTMVGSGFLLHRGLVDPIPIIATCYVATLIGDSIPFWLGRHFGMSVVDRPWARRILHPERMVLLRKRFDTHGNWAIFTCRFLPGVRMPGFFTAGVAGMSYGRFLLFDGLGALIMTPTWVLLGRSFGERISDLEGTVTDLEQYLGFALATAVLILVLRGLVRRRERQVRDLEEDHESSQPPRVD
jgi:membrane protein DedA with SNARE-associated domain